jgi:DNA-directed RNA polymerase I subunit RPA12
MHQYKNGLFCSTCGSFLEMPLVENEISCPRCRNSTPLAELRLEHFREEKIFSRRKPWIQEYYDGLPKEALAEAKDEPTIEQQCGNKDCDSNLCFYTSRQMRSADEGETIFYQCVKCKTRFTLNN